MILICRGMFTYHGAALGKEQGICRMFIVLYIYAQGLSYYLFIVLPLHAQHHAICSVL